MFEVRREQESFFLFTDHYVKLCGAISFLSKSIGSSDRGKTGRDVMLANHLRLMPRLRMDRATSAPPMRLNGLQTDTFTLLFFNSAKTLH